MPSPDDVGEARFWIKRLARELKTVPFEPHITVVGGFEVDVEEASGVALRLAALRQPFSVKLTGIDVANEHFRAASLLVEPTPSLAALHDAVETALGVDRELYQPHMSLIYGDLDHETKRKAVENLDLPLPLEITVDRLALWATDPQLVVGWREVASLPFGV